MTTRVRPSLACLAGLLMLLASACTAAPASDTATGQALTGPCATILFVGARGSGESASQQMALGSTLFEIYSRIRQDNPHVDITGFGLPYAANSLSDATIGDASTQLRQLLRSEARRCPSERFMVVGYSLGARVVGDAMQVPEATAFVDQLAGVVIVSDPQFNPQDRATAAGTFDSHYGGTPPRPPFPAAIAPKIHSYCRRHDEICQHGDPQANKREHALYAPEQTCQAVELLETATGLPPRCG